MNYSYIFFATKKSFIRNTRDIKMKPEITSEKKTRTAILVLAKAKGMDCYMQATMLLDKYDKLLKNCTNSLERKHIATMGVAEIHLLLDCYGDCIVDGKIIIPGEPPKEAE